VQEARKARSHDRRMPFGELPYVLVLPYLRLAGFFVYKSSALLVMRFQLLLMLHQSLLLSYQLNLQKDRLIVNIPLVMDDMSQSEDYSLESF